MAESVINETVANLSATVNETAKNVTGRAAATPEGLFVAYSSLVLMALLPIFFGSFRSVKCLIEQKVCWSRILFFDFRQLLFPGFVFEKLYITTIVFIRILITNLSVQFCVSLRVLTSILSCVSYERKIHSYWLPVYGEFFASWFGVKEVVKNLMNCYSCLLYLLYMGKLIHVNL